MYKNLFVRVWELLLTPSKTWDNIAQDSEDDKKYLSGYFYPLIGLAAFTAFLNPFISGYEELDFRATLIIGIQKFLVSFASVFFGFFVSVKALDYSFVRWFDLPSNNRKAEVLTAYASTPILVVSILTRLLSDFFFMKIFFVYIVVLVWEASIHFYSIEEVKRGKFTATACFIIVALPILIEKIFLLLLPGIK